jgi:hypothetical protein
METINLYCKRCSVALHLSDAGEDCGELIIVCSKCRAKNIVAPYALNKFILSNLWRVVGWRD